MTETTFDHDRVGPEGSASCRCRQRIISGHETLGGIGSSRVLTRMAIPLDDVAEAAVRV